MKKLFSISVIYSFFLTNGYSQDGRTAPIDLGHPCPQGMCVTSASFMIDIFNFHKPRTNCQTGFGLCLRSHWEYTCGFPPYCLGQVNTGYRPETKIENGKVSGWFSIVNGKLELHLPVALETANSFQNTDFSTFHLDPDMIYLKNDQGAGIGKLKGGAYPVKKREQEFFVVIDLE